MILFPEYFYNTTFHAKLYFIKILHCTLTKPKSFVLDLSCKIVKNRNKIILHHESSFSFFFSRVIFNTSQCYNIRWSLN